MRYQTMFIIMLLLAIPLTSSAQFPWQKPTPRSKESIERILGPKTKQEPSRDLNIVWVWGIDKLHAKETHEYAWVMDRYVNVLLPQVPRVTVVPVMYFPKKEQWEKADLEHWKWKAAKGGASAGSAGDKADVKSLQAVSLQ